MYADYLGREAWKRQQLGQTPTEDVNMEIDQQIDEEKGYFNQGYEMDEEGKNSKSKSLKTGEKYIIK